jgi:hypothetical protein
MDPPQTRQEKKGSKRKDPYNQKSIRIQERLREQHNEKKKPPPVGSSKTVFSKQEKTVSQKPFK